MSNSENKRKLDELLGLAENLDSQVSPPQHTFEAGTQQVLTSEMVSSQKPTAEQLESFALESQEANAETETKRNLAQIDDLINVARRVMDHVYSIVTSSDILDAQTISAATKLISETRGLINEHLEIQKRERDFLNQIQLEEIHHRHQLELMEKKFELEKRKMESRNPPISTSGKISQVQTPGGDKIKSYTSADMMRMLDENKD